VDETLRLEILNITKLKRWLNENKNSNLANAGIEHLTEDYKKKCCDIFEPLVDEFIRLNFELQKTKTEKELVEIAGESLYDIVYNSASVKGSDDRFHKISLKQWRRIVKSKGKRV